MFVWRGCVSSRGSSWQERGFLPSWPFGQSRCQVQRSLLKQKSFFICQLRYQTYVGVQKPVEWQGRKTGRVSERCQQCFVPRICIASPDKPNTLPCLYSSGCTRDDFPTGFSQRLAVREFNIVAIRVANEAQITSVGVQKCGTEL